MTGRTRTRTGCWTCREDGYKCDEQKPHCGRCVRLKKECKGYGMKLKWRSTVATSSREYIEYKKGSRRGTSVDRISVAKPNINSNLLSVHSAASAPAVLNRSIHIGLYSLASLPASIPRISLNLTPRDQCLLQYWGDRLSRLISVAPNNQRASSFQLHLTSMTNEFGPLRSTILSMAANHLSIVSNDNDLRFQSYRYQRDAIYQLQNAIHNPSQRDLEPVLATVLMMQVSTRLFGEEEESHIANHLIGARALIMRKGDLAEWGTSSSVRFLLSLFAYHDILASVSRGTRPLIDHASGFVSIEATEKMESIAQVLKVVARISELQDKIKSDRMHSNNSSLSKDTFAIGTDIQQNLLSMDYSKETGTTENVEIGLTAQAYHHAAFIYLYRVWLGIGAPNPNTLGHVQQCISCIEQIPVESPLSSGHVWPLFTAGCEAVENSQRQLIRRRFENLYKSRKFPSLMRVMRDIEDVWSVKDMEQLTNGLDEMAKVDCIQVILQQRGREVHLA